LENLLIDFMTEPPELHELIDMVLDYNLQYIDLWLEAGIDVIWFHGDLGTQNGLLISPETFRKWLKPSYMKMFQYCRNEGVHVWYSSDGNVLDIVDDLVECGVSLHDPQVRANTIDGIASRYKGRLCALVDIDEQMLPHGTPAQIKDQVHEVVESVATPQGGLMIYAIPSSDVPFENIEALCEAWRASGSVIQ
jgi:uroporphyrinogen-III decarboxylase